MSGFVWCGRTELGWGVECIVFLDCILNKLRTNCQACILIELSKADKLNK
jgi:hypothetical protein